MPTIPVTREQFQFFVLIGLVFISGNNSSQAYHLGMLGTEPEWSLLDRFQKTMSRSEFVEALETVYLPYGYDEELITIYPGYALIKMDSDNPDASYRYDFAPWGPIEDSAEDAVIGKNEVKISPLEGLVIAIDPGHIGGEFSEMERRHFQIGNDPPIKEGDLTLLVAQKVQKRLRSLGATTKLLRMEPQPVTQGRPDDFMEIAESIEQQFWLEEHNFSLRNTPWETESFQRKIVERADMLFYRVSEIQARGELLNDTIRPDLTLAIHFNVSPWPEPTHQRLAKENHMHILVHGTYMREELALDDVRFHLFRKLLSRNHEVEIPLGKSVADSLAQTSGLPPFTYGGRNASNQGGNPNVWARNLLANRLYDGPVVFLEAYCSNSIEVYQRIQMGDYEGLRDVNGTRRSSLYNEYAHGVVEGLIDYYSNAR
jgi:hypothetical protein